MHSSRTRALQCMHNSDDSGTYPVKCVRPPWVTQTRCSLCLVNMTAHSASVYQSNLSIAMLLRDAITLQALLTSSAQTPLELTPLHRVHWREPCLHILQ